MRIIDADALSEHKFIGNKFIQIGRRTNGKTLETVNRAYQQGWNDEFGCSDYQEKQGAKNVFRS